MLQLTLVVEDAKISLEELEEEIQEIDDYVQSTDIAGESRLQPSCSRATLTRSHEQALDRLRILAFPLLGLVFDVMHCTKYNGTCLALALPLMNSLGPTLLKAAAMIQRI